MGTTKKVKGRWTGDAVITLLNLTPQWRGNTETMAWNTLSLTHYHWWQDQLAIKKRAWRNRSPARRERAVAAILARALNRMEAECGVKAAWSTEESIGDVAARSYEVSKEYPAR